jgi:hypothetical protein
LLQTQFTLIMNEPIAYAEYIYMLTKLSHCI